MKKKISPKALKKRLGQLLKDASRGDFRAYRKVASLLLELNDSTYIRRYKKIIEMSNQNDEKQTEKKQIHIPDYTPVKPALDGLTIKSFAENYGWKGNAEFVLERLKFLKFPYLTQLDSISEEAKDAFAISVGYDSFKELKEDRSKNQNKPICVLNIDEVAIALEMDSSDLFSTLIYEHAKDKTKQLSEPLTLGKLASACKIQHETVNKYIHSGVVKKNLTHFSPITTNDIDTFLSNLKKLRWKYDKNIPEHLKPYAESFIKQREKEKRQKIIDLAKSRANDEYEYNLKYETLSLEELGSLYKGGLNEDLDDIEKDVIKRIINDRINNKNRGCPEFCVNIG